MKLPNSLHVFIRTRLNILFLIIVLFSHYHLMAQPTSNHAVLCISITQENGIDELNEESGHSEINIQSDKEGQNKQILIFSLLFIFLITGITLYSSYRRRRRDRDIIAYQKTQLNKQFNKVEVKNREIMESISYARHILTTFIPEQEEYLEHFTDSFVLFKPSEIIGGDFYWLNSDGNRLFFAVADCTGHGVPGALLSIFCTRALNRAVGKNQWVRDPGMILDNVAGILSSDFKEKPAINDGMDLAFCSIEGNTLNYAGAKRPLWLIRKMTKTEPKMKTGEMQMQEMNGHYWVQLLGNKQSIGIGEKCDSFETKSISLIPGDRVYLFSDGYTDQFGGERRKKFQAKRLIETLIEVQDKSMAEQKQHLIETFDAWKGNERQIDDICVVAIEY